MAVTRCADCGSLGPAEYKKECPYCEGILCSHCTAKQMQLFRWNGCSKCCIQYRVLLHQNAK